MKRKCCEFKNFSSNMKNHFLCSWDYYKVVQLIIQLVQLFGEFSPTFSLLKIAYLIHFKLKSYYLSKLSYFYLGHHFSLQNYMRWRETQNPNGFFLLPSSVVCWSSAKEVSTLNPRSLSNSRIRICFVVIPMDVCFGF